MRSYTDALRSRWNRRSSSSLCRELSSMCVSHESSSSLPLSRAISNSIRKATKMDASTRLNVMVSLIAPKSLSRRVASDTLSTRCTTATRFRDASAKTTHRFVRALKLASPVSVPAVHTRRMKEQRPGVAGSWIRCGSGVSSAMIPHMSVSSVACAGLSSICDVISPDVPSPLNGESGALAVDPLRSTPSTGVIGDGGCSPEAAAGACPGSGALSDEARYEPDALCCRTCVGGTGRVPLWVDVAAASASKRRFTRSKLRVNSHVSHPGAPNCPSFPTRSTHVNELSLLFKTKVLTLAVSVEYDGGRPAPLPATLDMRTWCSSICRLPRCSDGGGIRSTASSTRARSPGEVMPSEMRNSWVRKALQSLLGGGRSAFTNTSAICRASPSAM
mmetsp:Transcript_36569/g.112692  ORF Transcript_36569/g.112692 Transcript_36569/m.112692 type:complete len:389 (+) Transcript_36569:483-1649(+)